MQPDSSTAPRASAPASGNVYRVGVDAGGTKTECIAIDDTGKIIARHLAPGCNPSVLGPVVARQIATAAVEQLRTEVTAANAGAIITHTHLYGAGNRAFWRETGAALAGFGEVFTADDSHPVLELATHGQSGLVLHGGTGSFVAARTLDGAIHYAGGTGWRFGDPGSGYDLGRRAIQRALLELQGWLPPSRLSPAVRAYTQLADTADAAALTRFFYYDAEPNRQIAGLAPTVLRLAGEGDATAHDLVAASIGDLLALAQLVAAKLFSPGDLARLPAGLSGPILTHPVVVPLLVSRSPLALTPCEGVPIEGVRRLLARATSAHRSP